MLGLLAAICAGGLLDQLPRPRASYDKLNAAFRNDREFVGRIEAMLPKGAMIYQMPFAEFPGSLPPGKMAEYDHMKGPLHSEHLRWSFGSMRGRAMSAWLAQLDAKPLDKIVEGACAAGFVGIYVDRNAYKDPSAEVEAGLRRLLKVKPIESADKRLIFFDMRPYLESGAASEPATASRPAPASSPASR